MAVAVAQVKKQQVGCRVRVPVAASKKILGGTLVFLAGGYATDVVADGNTVFAGIAVDTVDNSAGVAGEASVEVETRGVFELPSSGLAITDGDVEMYASDNYTTTKTSTNNSKIGRLAEHVSATVARIAIKGIGQKT